MVLGAEDKTTQGKNKPIVIVTGNGGTLGKAIETNLHSYGYLVRGTHDKQGRRLYDLTKPEDRECLVGGCDGGPQGLINCAGILYGSFSDIMELNVQVPAILADMASARGCTSVVNISSLVGKSGNYAPAWRYAASKAALNNVTLTQSRTLAPRTRVNAVLPGIFPSPIHDNARKHPEHGHALLGRQGTAEEVADVVCWVMQATYMTGALVEVGGGR